MLREMHLETRAVFRLVVLRALQLDDRVEHVFPAARAALQAALAGMVNEQDGYSAPSQVEYPSLHRKPAFGLVFDTRPAKGGNVVDHHQLDASQVRLEARLAFFGR